MLTVAARGQDNVIDVAATQPLERGIAAEARLAAEEEGRLHPGIADVHGAEDGLQSG